jgi:hypothetical protein
MLSIGCRKGLGKEQTTKNFFLQKNHEVLRGRQNVCTREIEEKKFSICFYV